MKLSAKRLIVTCAMVLLGLRLPTISLAGARIHVVPGPLDGHKVITPWGNFIVIGEGSSAWVGTEDEYEAARVKAVAQNLGFKEMHVAGAGPNTKTFVLSGLPSVEIGKTMLASIDIYIGFGWGSSDPPRPKKPDGSEYVGVVWVQSKKGKVEAHLVDRGAAKSYEPIDCGGDEVFHYCEFAMPREALTGGAEFMFTSKNSRPAVLPVPSIAKAHHHSISAKYKGGGSGMAISDDDRLSLEELHRLDPTIPASVR